MPGRRTRSRVNASSPRLALRPVCVRASRCPCSLAAGGAKRSTSRRIACWCTRQVASLRSRIPISTRPSARCDGSSKAPPSDATVVGQTWQYVNKDGGPDRRFAHNPTRTVVLYDSRALVAVRAPRTTSGLTCGGRRDLATALRGMVARPAATSTGAKATVPSPAQTARPLAKTNPVTQPQPAVARTIAAPIQFDDPLDRLFYEAAEVASTIRVDRRRWCSVD